MKRLFKEPLVHFLALGAMLFAAYSLLNRGTTGSAPGRIVITQGQLASMMENFTSTRQRPPTKEEWEGLIQARVREEVYYREALALGLDKDDTIIQRRLLQKMQFISDDTAVQAKPADAQLEAFLQTHADTFRVNQKFTFRQVYLNPEKHGANLARDAAELLAELNKPEGDIRFASMGDTFMLQSSFTAVSADEITRQLGREFTVKLALLQPGHWQGPVESAFGSHLVFISQRIEGRLPTLAEVRDDVIREWEEAQRVEANEKFYQELLKHYTVTIEQPSEAAKEKELAKAK